MKKLFLYMFLLVSLFALSYLVTLNIVRFRHASVMKGTNGDPTEAGVEKDKYNEDIILTEDILEDYDIAQDEPSVNANAIIENDTDYIITGNSYIVGIEDGYVIVYLNDKYNVYEFTDIDAAVLKIIDKELYDRISDNIVFDNEEELFDFLESISS